jgi:hypothetical protein
MCCVRRGPSRHRSWPQLEQLFGAMLARLLVPGGLDRLSECVPGRELLPKGRGGPDRMPARHLWERAGHVNAAVQRPLH